MSFSNEWDEQYKAHAHMSVWPWSDLVSTVHGFASPRDGYKDVLEIGCGAGANIPFFNSLDVNYSAIDGSETIVKFLHQRFPDLKEKIICGDFTKDLPFDQTFDLVVDRGSLVSNSTEDMRRGLALAVEKMRSGARFIGIDWFSDAHEGASLGTKVDDHTRNDFPTSSRLHGIGTIHFCTREHLEDLIKGAGLEFVHIAHKTHVTHYPANDGEFAWWNFVAYKP